MGLIKYNKLKNLFKQAYVIAENSKDLETQVGCIIVNEDLETLATGYNGFIRDGDDGSLPKVRPEKYDYMIHSEVNAVCQAASRGESLKGGICICTLSPCINCLRILYQAKVKTVYFHKKYKDFDKQLKMQDLKINLETVGDYTKIILEPRY